MLQNLSIKNYALIEHLNISFEAGFSSITGETGAGKSIILGALNLLLGQRADTAVLKDDKKKSVVEGVFQVADYQLESLFEELDLDYDHETIFRREILPSGKTRAFVNDVPVTLQILKRLAVRLIDIHSQDNTHSLNDPKFQLKVIDAFADNLSLRHAYQQIYRQWKDLKKQLNTLVAENAKNAGDLDYYRFQLEQLVEADLSLDEQEALEQEQDTMQHAEDIQNAYYAIYNSVEQESGVMDMLNAALQSAERASSHNVKLQGLTERLSSALIELQDLASEAQAMSEDLEFSPARMDEITNRLSLIYELQKKHHVDSISALLSLQQELEEKVSSIDSFDEKITEIELELSRVEQDLSKAASALTRSRKAACVPIQDFVVDHLKSLGMPNAQLLIACQKADDFMSTGIDSLSFKFSANKNSALQEVGKVASGGEKSRLMFTIKLLLAKKEVLPTLIFDEIDTGVSGEVARKMGLMMHEMGDELQVMSITHLPQVASCATHQYKVFKYDEKESTLTQIRQLNDKERLDEIARLLSGDALSEAALQNAKELLLN